MRNSSIAPSRYGFATNSERPIQSLGVLPKLGGRIVIGVVLPTWLPFRYKWPPAESSTTATCHHTPVDIVVGVPVGVPSVMSSLAARGFNGGNGFAHAAA